VDQHTQKRLEEVADVEKDKKSEQGLFKGVFPAKATKLWRDEEDGGILRCPACGHEHEGGPMCEQCGAEVDDDRFGDFSDVTDEDAELDELDELEIDLDREMAAELGMRERYFVGVYPPPGHRRQFAASHQHHDADLLTNSEGSEVETDSDEDAGSLQDFVVPDDDDEPVVVSERNRNIRRSGPAQPITISDDESDEGGAISNRRRRRAPRGSESPATVVTATDPSVNGSEAGDDAEMLRHAGWSPLDQGNDSDAESPRHFPQYAGYSSYGQTEDEHDSDDDSDTNTETMVGNGGSDDEGDRSREEFSATPTYQPYSPEYNRYGVNYHGEDIDDDSSEAGIMDRDGDTEMSVSPTYRRSLTSTPPANPYNSGISRSTREFSVSTDHESEYSASELDMETGEVTGADQYLGQSNEMHEVEGESSDTSLPPHPRRLPRRYHENANGQQYDPRISMLFAEHQHTMRGGPQDNLLIDLDSWDEEVRRIIEPASRTRRPTAYRSMPSRRTDPLRSSRSPSATRVISSSDRTTRNPRQYNQRRAN